MTTDVTYALVQSPFNDQLYQDVHQVANLAFTSVADTYLRWRLDNMPDVSVFTASGNNQMVGFKAGYASTETRYYSWLGGLDPAYQRRGIATQLMRKQHQWLQEKYATVETHVLQSNKAMVQLNINSGLVVSGFFDKHGEANFIMQKSLAGENRADHGTQKTDRGMGTRR